MAPTNKPIAITPTLFLGPRPPELTGHFVHVTTLASAAEVLMQRGMSEQDAWERIRWILTSD